MTRRARCAASSKRHSCVNRAPFERHSCVTGAPDAALDMPRYEIVPTRPPSVKITLPVV
jgi:hypothetical protein